ncbi:MAG TPA: helix-turn-helix domain-containing protein [Bellilinea sp.]|nr:helix-turn-helix domain-containing protein [Bellilinea sp.]
MVNPRKPQITGRQLRAARAWLGWTQQDLSDRSKISKRSIARFEGLETVAYDDTLDALQRTLEEAGMLFIFDGPRGVGVRAK